MSIPDQSAPITSTPVPAQPAGPEQVSPGQGRSAPLSYSGSTHVNSLAELKENAPKVYNQTMLGIATQIIREMKKRNDRIKKLIREARGP